MSGTKEEDVKEQGVGVDTTEKQDDVENSVQEQSDANKSDEHPMPSMQEEEEVIMKKYGGMLPRKHPLIAKDHERAFFDSADWALGKGGQKPKGPLEALRPKLQPTPHQQMRSRRSAYAPADEEEGDGGNNNNISSEDKTCASDGGNNNTTAPEDQNSGE